jgi:hypothetical protein
VTPASVIVLDDADVIAWEGGIFWAASLSIDPTVVVDVNTIALQIAGNVGTQFTPAGCATAGAVGNTVTLQLAGCTGPFGLTAATGAVVFVVGTNPGAITLMATSNNLVAGRAALTINATATLTGNGATRQLTVSTMGGGVGPRGNTADRSGIYTVTWNVGDTCALVDGTLMTGVNDASRTSFGAFNVCNTGCPRSGTVTVVDQQTGATSSTTYNGTSLVTVANSDGTSTAAILTCQ